MTIIDLGDGSSSGDLRAEIDAERVELTQALMGWLEQHKHAVEARLAHQDQKLAKQADAIAEMRGMLVTMGDLCHALAAAADRLTADS